MVDDLILKDGLAQQVLSWEFVRDHATRYFVFLLNYKNLFKYLNNVECSLCYIYIARYNTYYYSTEQTSVVPNFTLNQIF